MVFGMRYFLIPKESKRESDEREERKKKKKRRRRGREVFQRYGFKYGICLKCMDTCLGCMDSCRNLTLTPFFDEFWV